MIDRNPRLAATALVVSCLLALPGAASAPGQVSYQGLLLDHQGVPVQGNVAMVFDLYDAISGGSLLWSEAHPSVPVLDGVYDVVLGSSTPLTAGIVAGGSAFLEVTVNGETLAPRQQFNSVPYALHADTAGSASVATTALDVVGTPGDFYLEMVASFPFDGGDPPNTDPREGLADVDGDGTVNFLDSDNDDDGLPDADELAQGSDINLTTPGCCGFQPALAESSVTTQVVVSGSQFDPAMTFVFGSESPTPQSLTPTSFSVDVGPQPAGSAPVSVTLPNGQSGGSSFSFVMHQPVIDDISPSSGNEQLSHLVTLTGSGFIQGIAVSFGSESPAPMNITPTSLQVQVGPQPPGVVSVLLSYPSGKQASTHFEFTDAPRRVFVTSTSQNGNLGGLAGADALCNARAAAASLTGSYLAWLNDGVTNPASRLSTRPYVLTNPAATPVASSLADLLDGSVANPINVNEFGNAAAAGPVWTGTFIDGSSTTNHCLGWSSSSNANFGTAGSKSSQSFQWTNGSTPTCNNAAALYCFEQ